MPRQNDRRRGGRGSRTGGRPRMVSAPVVDNTPVPEGLVFYCKTCQQIVDYHPTTFNFKYPIEGCPRAKLAAAAAEGAGRPTVAETTGDRRRAEATCDIAYGTERSIKQYYKIKDDKFDQERKEREDRAVRADKL